MRKKEELSKTNSCMAHAHLEEMVFVLLGRDVAAPAAIHAWVSERLRLGKNSADDPQIIDALACADTMVAEGRQWVGADAHETLAIEAGGIERMSGQLRETRGALNECARQCGELRALINAATCFRFGEFYAEHIVDHDGSDYGWVVSEGGKWESRERMSRDEAIADAK